MSISSYYQGKVLDHMLRGVSFNPPVKIYASLHIADPGAFGLSELVSDGYERQEVTFNPAKGGSIDNSNTLDFTDMPVVTITHMGLWDAESEGQFLWSGLIMDPAGKRHAPMTIETQGNIIRIEALRFEVSID